MKMTLIKLIREYTVCIFMVILNHGTIKDYVFLCRITYFFHFKIQKV